MSEKLEFDLIVKNNQVDTALDTASKKSGNLQQALNTALGVFGGGVLLKGLDAVGDAIGNTIDFAKESVEAYSRQEDSVNRLSQALRASGDSTQSSLDDLVAYGDELERNSKQSGDAILQQLAYAKSLGLTNSQTKELVGAAANLAATFGGSLESNVALLGKTLNGTSGKLGAMIPELKELTKEQLAAGDAAAIINSKFGGAAASELDSYSGRVHALANAYEDIQKQVGGLIANSDVVVESQGALTFIFQQITEAIRDWRIESERQNAGFKESQESLDQLKRKYDELRVAAIDAEQIILNPSMFDTLLARPLAAASNLKILNDEIEATRLLIEQTEKSMAESTKPDEGGDGGRGLSQEIIDSRAKLNSEILFLDQQLVAEQNNLELERDNAKIENDILRQQAEIQRMTDFAATKAELEFQLKEAELARTLEGEEQRLALLKLAGEKELALTKIKNDGIIKQANLVRDAEKKASAERIALQQATASTITGIIGTAANLSVLLTKEGSKEQFYVQKAAALAQAVVAMNLAMAMANTVPPPGNIPAIAAAKANGAIAISGIVASAIKGFADGGIVGQDKGSSSVATMGPDNTMIKARDGEMVLTADDQKMLLSSIRNGGMNGGDIVIQIDGDTVFRVVRNKVKQGYKLA
jgi:hypothetical protein